MSYTIKVRDTIRDMTEEVEMNSLKEVMEYIMYYEDEGVFFGIYQGDTLVWDTTTSKKC